MLPKIAKRIGLAAGSFVALLGVEIYLAYTREYLPTEPALELGGTFGPANGEPLNFVVLGDSTAAGLGAGHPRHAYATVLSQRLAEKGLRVSLTALGVSGARARDLLEEQLPLALAAEPDLVFIGIGANDVTHVTPLRSIQSDMEEILDTVIATGAAVAVAGAPDMRAAAWLEPLRSIVGRRGRQVTERIEAVAHARDVPVVPLAKLAGPYFASDPEDAYATDDFHPGPGGYRAWADAIYPALEEALDQGPLIPDVSMHDA